MTNDELRELNKKRRIYQIAWLTEPFPMQMPLAVRIQQPIANQSLQNQVPACALAAGSQPLIEELL